MAKNEEYAQKERDIFASNFKRILNMRGKTQSEVADYLNVRTSTVSDWAKARKYPRVDKMQMIADYLGVVISDLREQRLPENAYPIDFSQYHQIPILGRISAGLPLYAEEHIEGYTITDLNGGTEYFALRVHGDSMNAAGINDGYLIIVRRQDEVEQGEIAVVMVGGDDATVKRFYSSETTVTLMPQSTNPEHKQQMFDLSKTAIHILGKVVKVEFLV